MAAFSSNLIILSILSDWAFQTDLGICPFLIQSPILNHSPPPSRRLLLCVTVGSCVLAAHFLRLYLKILLAYLGAQMVVTGIEFWVGNSFSQHLNDGIHLHPLISTLSLLRTAVKFISLKMMFPSSLLLRISSQHPLSFGGTQYKMYHLSCFGHTIQPSVSRFSTPWPCLCP